MDENKYQQKHHDKRSCRDKGRLPFLKVKFATTPRSCLPASPDVTVWASPFPFLLRLPLCDSPMPNSLSVLVWQGAGESKDCHQVAAKNSDQGKTDIGKTDWNEAQGDWPADWTSTLLLSTWNQDLRKYPYYKKSFRPSCIALKYTLLLPPTMHRIMATDTKR